MPTRKHLKSAGISSRTLGIYRREVSLFFGYLDAEGLPLARSYSKLDQQVANYINHLFQEDESLTKAGWLLSGIKRLYPRVRRELAISQQWYNNWCREHLPRRATPITWPLIQAFSGVCFQLGWPRLASLLLIGFVFFPRTREMLDLCAGDVRCQPKDGCIILRIASSKTSPLAQQSLAHFDQPLASLLVACLGSFEADEPLWPWSVSFFRQCFTQLVKFFDLELLQLVPYSIRRGGATYFYTKTNSLDSVMIRGRWKDQQTARQYLDDARATLVRLTLPAPSIPLVRRFRLRLLAEIDRCASGQVKVG